MILRESPVVGRSGRSSADQRRAEITFQRHEKLITSVFLSAGSWLQRVRFGVRTGAAGAEPSKGAMTAEACREMCVSRGQET